MKNLLLLIVAVSGLAQAQAYGPAYNSRAYQGPVPTAAIPHVPAGYWEKRAADAQSLDPLYQVPNLPPERAAQVQPREQYTGPQVPDQVQIQMRDMVR